jgi:hypothetical protein
MKRSLFVFGVLATVVLATRAEADGGTLLGETISKCFHPSAEFVSVAWSERRMAEHTVTKTGTIRYSTPDGKLCSLPVTLEMRQVERDRTWRVLPDASQDTGPLSPDPLCKLREWQSIR